MLPLALCVLGPLASFLGSYVYEAMISLHEVAGPLAVVLVGVTFSLLVMAGMHQVLFAFLFVSFPMLGYDGFILPAMIISSWQLVELF
ncbi:phosphotransferase system glucose/maltose/N-acetylglucosamine-specific IIC component [Breznakia sp. PH1-1]|nr:phosphotransferase system glucose/maltose/N-acetylglucosamine-specific IIC component [Breznakia sp. PH1-1]MDH6405045.1 phosphotransferase system glucose/maltose/N-acetylglucosamine-specific IIC component [Breznakia sp. PF1-11]MDH6412760.1 phosphotransferase system glucose/maltose/N-acetylglucosamine-specific IIC component [Breznakia sp. PFB1-11]MDH6415103.1 phosphotransferase system glucose/maltose/N-acetylglucosamine-specific IIC component [Breznakia sp. PFB1-14]MDH6417431.1 phosphotransfer